MNNITKDTTRKELFGCLDASDEQESVLKNYFLETTAYKKVNSNENIYILVGEKGTGKSAIMKMCMINDKENNSNFAHEKYTLSLENSI
jgi:ABC-type ATPase involved in cell division